MPLPPHLRLSDVDRWIAAAYSDLGVVRARFDDLPSADGFRACEAAEERFNELLDLRLALRGRPAAAASAATSLRCDGQPGADVR
jgi:hypothetical protein